MRILLFIYFTILTHAAIAQNKCVIKGELLQETPEKTLVLIVEGEDPRIKGVEIPVTGNRFEYEMEFGDVMEYCLIRKSHLMRGYYRSILFHPKEGGTITFTLHEDSKKDRIDGDPEFENELKYKKAIEKPSGELKKINFSEIDQYNEDGKVLIEEADKIKDRNQALKRYERLNSDKTLFTDEYNKAMEIYTKLREQISDLELDFISKNRTIYSYSLLYGRLRKNSYENTDLSGFKKAFWDIYSEKYPNHTYTKTLEHVLMGLELHVGGDYPDFSAPDVEGNEQKLSSLIKGKVAVIDLWASW